MSTVTLTPPDGIESGELDGTKVAISAAELPSPVAARLLSRFPEAKLTEAAIEVRGGALSYTVGAAANGREVDMAMTGTGESLSSDLPLRSANVRLIELDTTASDPADIPVRPGDLPSRVTDAIVDRFPSAQLIGADFSRSAESREFGIVAQVGARVLDATVTSHGNVIETSELLPSGELPQAVVAWVQENFGSGAGIGRAEAVVDRGVPGYQVVVAPPGSQALEATLRVGDVSARRDPEDSADKHADEPATDRLDTPASFNPMIALVTPPDNHGQSDESMTADPPRVSDGSPAAVSDRQGTPEPGEPTHNRIESQPRIAKDSAQDGTEPLIGGSQASAEASRPHLAAPTSPPFLPRIARELARLVPLDISGIGMRVRGLLRNMDGFAARDGHARTRGVAAVRATATVPLALAVAAAAACMRLTANKKSRRQRQASPSFWPDSAFGYPCAAPRVRTRRRS